MATHSSILAWRIPRTEETGKLQSMGSQRVRHDWGLNNFIFTFTLIKRLFSPASLSAISYSIGSSLARDGTWVSWVFLLWEAASLPLHHVGSSKHFIWYHERPRFFAITPLYLLFGVSYHCTFQFISIFSSQFKRFVLECLTGMLYWNKNLFLCKKYNSLIIPIYAGL